MMADRATTQTRSRYDRLARILDRMEAPVERSTFSQWRRGLWAQVEGKRILEVGVGTGKNIPHYPPDARVTAVDLSAKMLALARHRAQQLGAQVDLRLMDAQELDLPAAAFDAAVATFVFCSVPDPIAGLRELNRVVKPGGRVFLLEHVRVDKPPIGTIMDILDPLVVQVMGAHINRRTEENVGQAGLEIERVQSLAWEGLVKLIVARAQGA